MTAPTRSGGVIPPFEAMALAEAQPVTLRVLVVNDFDLVELQRRDGFHGAKWAVTMRGHCLNRSTRDWEWEPQPSSRDERFFRECRFDTVEAAFACWRAARAAGLEVP